MRQASYFSPISSNGRLEPVYQPVDSHIVIENGYPSHSIDLYTGRRVPNKPDCRFSARLKKGLARAGVLHPITPGKKDKQ